MATVNQKNQSANSKAPNLSNKQNNNARPKVRNTTDSRKNEEFDFKGDDITHNKKKTRKEK